jgi:hypothetical protein
MRTGVADVGRGFAAVPKSAVPAEAGPHSWVIHANAVGEIRRHSMARAACFLCNSRRCRYTSRIESLRRILAGCKSDRAARSPRGGAALQPPNAPAVGDFSDQADAQIRPLAVQRRISRFLALDRDGVHTTAGIVQRLVWTAGRCLSLRRPGTLPLWTCHREADICRCRRRSCRNRGGRAGTCNACEFRWTLRDWRARAHCNG